METEAASAGNLAGFIIPTAIVLCLLCLLFCSIFHLYFRRNCDKGSDVANFLFVLLAASYQASNALSTTVITLALTYPVENWLFSCLIINAQFLVVIWQINVVVVLSILVFWSHFRADHFATMYQRVLRRIFTFGLGIAFSYSLFLHWMTCSAKSFYPVDAAKHLREEYTRKTAEMLRSRPAPGVECRVHVSLTYLPLGCLIALLLTIATNIKNISDLILRVLNQVRQLLQQNVEDIELTTQTSINSHAAHAAAAPAPPLPPIHPPKRLQCATIVITIYLTTAIAVLARWHLATGDVRAHCGNVVLTALVPLLWLLLERQVPRGAFTCSTQHTA